MSKEDRLKSKEVRQTKRLDNQRGRILKRVEGNSDKITKEEKRGLKKFDKGVAKQSKGKEKAADRKIRKSTASSIATSQAKPETKSTDPVKEVKSAPVKTEPTKTKPVKKEIPKEQPEVNSPIPEKPKKLATYGGEFKDALIEARSRYESVKATGQDLDEFDGYFMWKDRMYSAQKEGETDFPELSDAMRTVAEGQWEGYYKQQSKEKKAAVEKKAQDIKDQKAVETAAQEPVVQVSDTIDETKNKTAKYEEGVKNQEEEQALKALTAKRSALSAFSNDNIAYMFGNDDKPYSVGEVGIQNVNYTPGTVAPERYGNPINRPYTITEDGIQFSSDESMMPVDANISFLNGLRSRQLVYDKASDKMYLKHIDGEYTEAGEDDLQSLENYEQVLTRARETAGRGVDDDPGDAYYMDGKKGYYHTDSDGRKYFQLDEDIK